MLLNIINERADLIVGLEENHVLKMVELAKTGFPQAGIYPKTKLIEQVINFDTTYHYSDSLTTYQAGVRQFKFLTEAIKELEDKELASILSAALLDHNVLHPYFPEGAFDKNPDGTWEYKYKSSSSSAINLYLSDLTLSWINRCIKGLMDIQALCSNIDAPPKSGAVMSRATKKKTLRASECYSRVAVNSKSQKVIFTIDKIIADVFDNALGRKFLGCLVYADRIIEPVPANLSFYNNRPYFKLNLNHYKQLHIITE